MFEIQQSHLTRKHHATNEMAALLEKIQKLINSDQLFFQTLIRPI